MKFTNWLRESPQFMNMDAPFEEVTFTKIQDISERIIEIDFDLVKENIYSVKHTDMDLYKSKDHSYYILGKWHNVTETKKRFAVIFDISFKETTLRSKQKQASRQLRLNNKQVIKIETAHAAKDFRGNKIATNVYIELTKNTLVMSDKFQYKGAKNLWKGLIENDKITVYIYDSLTDKIISKCTKHTPDEAIWSLNTTKQRIRLIALYE